MSSAMPSMASGRRAMTELPRMRSAPGVEVNVVMGRMLTVHWCRWKIHFRRLE